MFALIKRLYVLVLFVSASLLIMEKCLSIDFKMNQTIIWCLSFCPSVKILIYLSTSKSINIFCYDWKLSVYCQSNSFRDSCGPLNFYFIKCSLDVPHAMNLNSHCVSFDDNHFTVMQYVEVCDKCIQWLNNFICPQSLIQLIPLIPIVLPAFLFLCYKMATF